MDDNYILCIQCKEFVLELCSLHGPPLIIPDSKIYNTHKSFIIDGGDPNKSNWMRYVNCSRHFNEQNLIAYQQNEHIYYCTIKPIPAYTELLVYYGSEFAHLLNIDLRKYNKPESFISNIYTKKLIKWYKDIPINYKNGNCSEPKRLQNGVENAYSSNTNPNISEINENAVLKPDSTKDVFVCDICDRKFNLKYSLTRHKRSHLSTKRFKCNYCHYESNQNYNLTIHINSIHTKEVTYTCTKCSKVFYVKKNYRRHQRLHLNK